MAEEEKEGYWDKLSKWPRDYILWPITRVLGIIPYAANWLTIAGFFILFWAIIDFLYYKQRIERQIKFLAAVWITDFLDGPTARNNNNVTALGTAADHSRDHCAGFWMLFLSFYVTLASFEGFAAFIMYVVLGATVLGMLGVIYSTWAYSREKRAERPDQPFLIFFQEFLIKDLVTSGLARLHTFTLAVGDIFYLAGRIWDDVLYTEIGIVLLVLQLFFLGGYCWELRGQSYEDKTYKFRLALQKKVELLEETLKKFKEKIKD